MQLCRALCGARMARLLNSRCGSGVNSARSFLKECEECRAPPTSSSPQPAAPCPPPLGPGLADSPSRTLRTPSHRHTAPTPHCPTPFRTTPIAPPRLPFVQAQLDGQAALLDEDKEQLLQVDLAASAGAMPELCSVRPLAVTPSYSGPFMLTGRNIGDPQDTLFCRNGGALGAPWRRPRRRQHPGPACTPALGPMLACLSCLLWMRAHLPPCLLRRSPLLQTRSPPQKCWVVACCCAAQTPATSTGRCCASPLCRRALAWLPLTCLLSCCGIPALAHR